MKWEAEHSCSSLLPRNLKYPMRYRVYLQLSAIGLRKIIGKSVMFICIINYYDYLLLFIYILLLSSVGGSTPCGPVASVPFSFSGRRNSCLSSNSCWLFVWCLHERAARSLLSLPPFPKCCSCVCKRGVAKRGGDGEEK